MHHDTGLGGPGDFCSTAGGGAGPSARAGTVGPVLVNAPHVDPARTVTHVVDQWSGLGIPDLPDVRFSEAVSAPDPRLSRHVINYAHGTADNGPAGFRRALAACPDPYVHIVLEGEQQVRGIATDLSAPITGPILVGIATRRKRDLTQRGRARIVQVHFQPAALAALTGVNPGSFVDWAVPLDRAFGIDAGTLVERLRATSTPDEERVVLDAFLLERLASARPLDAVADIARCVRMGTGEVGTAAMAAAASLSPRHFARRFARAVGVTPHMFERLVRVHHALVLHQDDPGRSWAQISYAAGFADQSHLIRDFRQLARVRPTRFRLFEPL